MKDRVLYTSYYKQVTHPLTYLTEKDLLSCLQGCFNLVLMNPTTEPNFTSKDPG